MNLTINTNAALDDAAQINTIVAEMEEDMATLNSAITENIPEGIQTDWSDTVRNNWEGYYTADVPETMQNMKESANNLKKAVDQALAYNND